MASLKMGKSARGGAAPAAPADNSNVSDGEAEPQVVAEQVTEETQAAGEQTSPEVPAVNEEPPVNEEMQKAFPRTITVTSHCFMPVQVAVVYLNLPAYESRDVLVQSQDDLDKLKNDLASIATINGFDASVYEVKD